MQLGFIVTDAQNDRKNRQSFIRMLRSFDETLVVVTHDVELLGLFDAVWHNGKKSGISSKKQILTEKMSALRLPEVIKPTFSIQAGDSGRVLVSMIDKMFSSANTLGSLIK